MDKARQALQAAIFTGKLAALLMSEYKVKLVWVEEPPAAGYAFRGPGIDLDIVRLTEELDGG